MNCVQARPPYDPIADEYYDPLRHPTCANFGELSRNFLAPRIGAIARSSSRSLEVGAGRSILASVFEEQCLPLRNVTLLDHSTSMLSHSRKWADAGATLMVADARCTNFSDGAFDLIVSSLGDPYDDLAFWSEMRRIVSDWGVLLFTTPSFEWSEGFRTEEDRDTAEFMLRDGLCLTVPSLTRPLAQERAMFANANFVIVEEVLPTVKEIAGRQSPKLNVVTDNNNPVLYCFALRPLKQELAR